MPKTPDELVAAGIRAVADANHQHLCACSAWPYTCLSGYKPDQWEHGDEATFLAAVLPALRQQIAEEARAVWPDSSGAWNADQADAARATKEQIIRRITRGGPDA